MATFEDVYARLLANGDPYRNQYGWEGFIVDIGEIAAARKDLLVARLHCEVTNIAGASVAYLDAERPRIVEDITFETENPLLRSMRTVVGANEGNQRLSHNKQTSPVSPREKDRVLLFVASALSQRDAS